MHVQDKPDRGAGMSSGTLIGERTWGTHSSADRPPIKARSPRVPASCVHPLATLFVILVPRLAPGA